MAENKLTSRASRRGMHLDDLLSLAALDETLPSVNDSPNDPLERIIFNIHYISMMM